MNTSSHTFKHLSIIDRTKIELWRNQNISISEIARRLGRSKGAISYELNRYKNTALYKAETAQIRANIAKRNSKKPAKADNAQIMQDIERMIKRRWSPRIIAHELGYAVSHTTIYRIIKSVRPEWKKYLIYQKKYKYHKGKAGKTVIPGRVDISLRSAAINNRERVGDWEADTVMPARGGKSVLAVFAERMTRLYKIVKMVKCGSGEMAHAALKVLSGTHVISITYDNGHENAKHELVNEALGCESYFCRAYCSGDKGLVEERNKLLRWYLPKGTKFDLLTDEELIRIENEINERPMECLNWISPKQAFQNAQRSN